MNFTGVIIEESLQDASILDEIGIIDTKIEEVTPTHETPWLYKWTLHTVLIPSHDAESIAEKLASVLDVTHIGNWYADFKNDQFHYMIFPNKVFKLDRKNKTDWDAMQEYAISIGLPQHQTPMFEG